MYGPEKNAGKLVGPYGMIPHENHITLERERYIRGTVNIYTHHTFATFIPIDFPQSEFDSNNLFV